MSELKTRIKLLYRTYEQWTAYTEEFILLKGEICFCEIPQGAIIPGIDTSVARVLLKVGDEVTPFTQLKWVSALPATPVGSNTKYRIAPAKDSQGVVIEGKWKLQVSIDGGEWQDIEGSTDVDFTSGLARIALLETKVDALDARLTTAEQNITDIKRLSDEEIHHVID